MHFQPPPLSHNTLHMQLSSCSRCVPSANPWITRSLPIALLLITAVQTGYCSLQECCCVASLHAAAALVLLLLLMRLLVSLLAQARAHTQPAKGCCPSAQQQQQQQKAKGEAMNEFPTETTASRSWRAATELSHQCKKKRSM
jgi:hypothetical protein